MFLSFKARIKSPARVLPSAVSNGSSPDCFSAWRTRYIFALPAMPAGCAFAARLATANINNKVNRIHNISKPFKLTVTDVMGKFKNSLIDFI